MIASGERFSLDVNLFHNRIRDLIQTDTSPTSTWNGVAAYRYDNVARARTAGRSSRTSWVSSIHLA